MRPSGVKIEDVRRVVDDGKYNAFTDLTHFAGRFYLTFRSSPYGHMIFPSTSIVVMSSADGYEWAKEATFSVVGRDLRDPHFLNTGHRLFIFSGAWQVKEGDPNHKDFRSIQSYFVHSDDGANWTEPEQAVGSEGFYFWRTGYHAGTMYVCAKRYKPPTDAGWRENNPQWHQSVLLKSSNGQTWREVSTIAGEWGDETSFLFRNDGSILAVGRSREPEPKLHVSEANPPYSNWMRRSVPGNIGGPLLVDINSGYMVAGRRMFAHPSTAKTVLCWLAEDTLEEFAELPSNGDSSYPGYVWTGPEEGLLSYYSSHQNQPPACSIYLARLRWQI